MKKHIPNLITSLNVFTGAVGCVDVLINQDPERAIWYVLIAGVFDFLDGFVARLLNVQSEIGKELDSLADVVSFGVLPAICLTLMLGEALTSGIFDFRTLPTAGYLGLLVVPFSAYRLAKFNISTDQSEEFKGLPTPANALLITGFAYGGGSYLSDYFLIGLTIISCLLLISNLRMAAFKFKSYGWEYNQARWIILGGLVSGLAIFQLNFIPFVIPTYIGLSLIGNYLITPRVSI